MVEFVGDISQSCMMTLHMRTLHVGKAMKTTLLISFIVSLTDNLEEKLSLKKKNKKNSK